MHGGVSLLGLSSLEVIWFVALEIACVALFGYGWVVAAVDEFESHTRVMGWALFATMVYLVSLMVVGDAWAGPLWDWLSAGIPDRASMLHDITVLLVFLFVIAADLGLHAWAGAALGAIWLGRHRPYPRVRHAAPSPSSAFSSSTQ